MNSPVQVVPAILTDDPNALETMVRQSEDFTDFVQIDIMDGRFVPSQSIGHQHIAAVSPKLNWEAHLMVEHPEDCLEDYRSSGAQKVVFHYEATPAPGEVIVQARGLGLGVGLALNPETPVSVVQPLLSQVDSVLLLTVNPGFYGSSFIPGVLGKVSELRQARPDIEIGVDGGIKESNIADIAREGVDVICVGSAVFMQPQPGESFRHLLALARKASLQS